MAKVRQKTMWFCTECGADAPKWTGKCPGCGAWNTMVEEKISTASAGTKQSAAALGSKGVPRPVNQIEAVKIE